ncbi:helix-loop-helix DNA-binding domain-containing protein [Suillus occidentalis]|nr:helix-loop-helix DNA-binding domain-containing protein [Suillus occidentalis]
MGGFFVPSNQGEYSLPTPDSLSHSFGGFQGYNAAASNTPYPGSNSYASQAGVAVGYGSFNGHGRTGTPSMGISPSEVSTLGMLASGAASPPGPAPIKGKHTDGDGLSEKRRRRRESHNAVERRRRDNINERIGELAGLIPGVLFECDAPLIAPTSPTLQSATSPTIENNDLFSLPLLPDASNSDEGLPDVPENGVPGTPLGGGLKKDPSEDGDDGRGGNGGVNGGIPTNGITTANGSEPQMIKANKGMILRKSVEYIRYLQQLVSVQASRGRDLEERNRALERELAAIRGTPLPSSSSRSASNSNSTDSSRLSLASSQTSLAQSQSSWESEKKWEMEMDVEERLGGEDEERGRGRVRARKEDGGGKIREEGERDMEI